MSIIKIVYIIQKQNQERKSPGLLNNAKAGDEHREAKSKTAQLTLIILIPL